MKNQNSCTCSRCLELERYINIVNLLPGEEDRNFMLSIYNKLEKELFSHEITPSILNDNKKNEPKVLVAPSEGVGWDYILRNRPKSCTSRIHIVHHNGVPSCRMWNVKTVEPRKINLSYFLAHDAACKFCKEICYREVLGEEEDREI